MIVLITGASGGFGRVLGETLASRDMTVYGSCRTPDPSDQTLPFTMLPMEATDSESVRTCVETVVDREGRVDVLINCVNQMVIGSIEEQTVDEVRALYEANVFGVLRICQQVIPIMRKQGGGLIINMSSLGGILAVPLMSAYTSAKFALEAMSEAMYHELKPDHIDVVIMQPVAMKIDRPALGAHLNLVAGVRPDSRSHKMVARMTRDTAASGLTPEAVADKIHAVITSGKRPLRVPMDRARALTVVKRLAPQAIIDKLISGLL